MPRIGVLSDTHGLLRPEAKALLAGSDAILHAGDIGRPEILDELAAIAPLTAVRGNNDTGAWAERLPEQAVLQIGPLAILVLHDRAELGDKVEATGARVVVTGHSHKPVIREAEGVLYLNPGSAGPRRFRLPVTVAELVVSGLEAKARILELQLAPRR
jgi:putative phosphoesterase